MLTLVGFLLTVLALVPGTRFWFDAIGNGQLALHRTKAVALPAAATRAAVCCGNAPSVREPGNAGSRRQSRTPELPHAGGRGLLVVPQIPERHPKPCGPWSVMVYPIARRITRLAANTVGGRGGRVSTRPHDAARDSL